jgi:hypothetical protein
MIQVYLFKHRYARRAGKRNWRYAMRWKIARKWQYESTGTQDALSAEGLRKRKFDELNGLVPVAIEPVTPDKASWQQCRDALERSLKADNCRPTYIFDALLTFDVFHGMFPEVKTPADVTEANANEYKRRRSEAGLSPWTIKGDLAVLKASFGKWLAKECKLLDGANPFEGVKAPRCDDPDIRIVTAEESKLLFDWFRERWDNWQLPALYLDVAMLLGWRATEIASVREDGLLPGGFVRVDAASCKTRKHKYGWLPPETFDELRGCAAGGYAFGKFSDELRRRLLFKHRANQAACVRDFEPCRLVGWMQDELKRFNGEQPKPWEKFTLHDFRRTAITGMQMAGVSEKEASIMVGATPEVIRKHYEKMDAMAIAKRSVERGLTSNFGRVISPSLARPLRAAAS